jgi:thioredoxin 2
VVRDVAVKLTGKAVVVQINTQDNPAVASRFGVRSIPVIILLKQGRLVDQLPGAQSLEAVLAWFWRRG